MEEQVVRKVMREYLSKRNQEFTEERGAGPDFLKRGKAVEVKGSGFNQKEALEQLTRYAFKYAGVEFAFPLDDLTPELMYGLRAIERAASTRALTEKKDIRIHLFAQVNNVTFGVESVDSAQELMKKVESTIDNLCYLSSSTTAERAIDSTRSLAVSTWKLMLQSLTGEVTREHNRIELPS